MTTTTPNPRAEFRDLPLKVMLGLNGFYLANTDGDYLEPVWDERDPHVRDRVWFGTAEEARAAGRVAETMARSLMA